jgi:hypothetical protein
MPDPIPTQHQEIDGYSDPNFTIVGGSTDAGLFDSSSEPGKGTQAGVQAQAASVAGHATIGEMLGSDPSQKPEPSENPGLIERGLEWLFGTPTAPTDPTQSAQGGWQNALSAEAHGPNASMDANIGTAGGKAQVGGDAVGASVTIGGAEYDRFGGSELTVGGSVGVGGGASYTWSNDDRDGCRELGASVSFEELEGVSVSGKTEALCKADNYLGPPVLDAGDRFLQDVNALVPPDPGLQPMAPAPSDPLHPTEIGFGR